MAEDMFAAIWFIDCCKAADTCVSSSVAIAACTRSWFCTYDLAGRWTPSWASSACAMPWTPAMIFADSCCCSWVCRASVACFMSMDPMMASAIFFWTPRFRVGFRSVFHGGNLTLRDLFLRPVRVPRGTAMMSSRQPASSPNPWSAGHRPDRLTLIDQVAHVDAAGI